MCSDILPYIYIYIYQGSSATFVVLIWTSIEMNYATLSFYNFQRYVIVLRHWSNICGKDDIKEEKFSQASRKVYYQSADKMLVSE